MGENKLLQLIYALFLGLLLALFIGVGINTFYPGPKEPDYATASYYGKEPTAAEIATEKANEQKRIAYEKELQPYSRNVSIIAMGFAVVLLVISIVLEKRTKVIAEGLMLGGLFTLLYSVMRGFMSNNSKYLFVAITIGIIITLYVGYHRFVLPESKTKKADKKLAKD